MKSSGARYYSIRVPDSSEPAALREMKTVCCDPAISAMNSRPFNSCFFETMDWCEVRLPEIVTSFPAVIVPRINFTLLNRVGIGGSMIPVQGRNSPLLIEIQGRERSD